MALCREMCPCGQEVGVAAAGWITGRRRTGQTEGAIRADPEMKFYLLIYWMEMTFFALDLL